MNETLTGKKALLAILEGTHWWQSGPYEHNKIFYRDDGLWHKGLDGELYPSKWERFDWEAVWTRGEPVEGVPEKKTKTITLWRPIHKPTKAVGAWSQTLASLDNPLDYRYEMCDVEVPE